MISQDATIGDIAIEHPGATAVFRRYKIDFCGDGGASLSQAALKRGLSVLELQTELNGLATGHGALPTDPDGLIAHIISRYHEVHMAE